MISFLSHRIALFLKKNDIVSTANTNLSLYFPYIPNAEIADTNLNGIINHIDQMNIMYFYTYLSVG